jgi:secreted trypsin-like serine protease
VAIVGGTPPRGTSLDAVVQVGDCSGVLVTADAVLTSAHCLEGRPTEVLTAHGSAKIASCRRHDGYQPMRREHDIGLCRLSEPLTLSPLALDDGPDLPSGAPVSLAGFGLPEALSRDPPRLRVVQTSVVAAVPEGYDVGTAQATACRGDSGGPLLVARGAGLRVAGLVHGPAGAICASATEVVATGAHRAWLDEALMNEGRPPPSPAVYRVGAVGVALALALALALVASMRRSRTPR